MNRRKEFKKYLEGLMVKPGQKVSLKNFDTDYDHKLIEKSEYQEILDNGIKELARMQDILYAQNRYRILIVLQAMDAAGKDGLIKHVISGLNPSGVKVASFKAPNSQELDHDYFWRHYKELPGRGEICIFNRSHYENVLVTRVHPEFLMGERLPGIHSVKDVDDKFWQTRFKQINRFEKNLAENGTIILKFFLHLSKDEQKKRFIARVDDPDKNWKFSPADARERQYWDEYQHAFEEMLENTSTEYAPWFVLPADDKWYTRLCAGGIILFVFEKLKLAYPSVSDEQRAELLKIKKELLAEDNKEKKPKKAKK